MRPTRRAARSGPSAFPLRLSSAVFALGALGASGCGDGSTQPDTLRFAQIGEVRVEVESAVQGGAAGSEGSLMETLNWLSDGRWRLEEHILYEGVEGDATVRTGNAGAGAYASLITQLNDVDAVKLFIEGLDPDLDPDCAPGRAKIRVRLRDSLVAEFSRLADRHTMASRDRKAALQTALDGVSRRLSQIERERTPVDQPIIRTSAIVPDPRDNEADKVSKVRRLLLSIAYVDSTLVLFQGQQEKIEEERRIEQRLERDQLLRGRFDGSVTAAGPPRSSIGTDPTSPQAGTAFADRSPAARLDAINAILTRLVEQRDELTRQLAAFPGAGDGGRR